MTEVCLFPDMVGYRKHLHEQIRSQSSYGDFSGSLVNSVVVLVQGFIMSSWKRKKQHTLKYRGQIRSPKQIQGLLRKPGEQLLTLGCLSLTDQSKQQPMFVLMRS